LGYIYYIIRSGLYIPYPPRYGARALGY